MTDKQDVQTLLGLKKPPIAIGFFEEAPEGLEQWKEGAVAAGCVFWKIAQAGKSFFTLASDHFNCPVGAHTHHIPLPVERASELEQTVGFMVSNKYLEMSEVAGIPTLNDTPKVIAYAPIADATFAPDVVLVSATPAQAMMLYEAALSAGVGNALTHTLGRPACAVLPLALNQNSTSISLGCKGNRTYTGLQDEEMYVATPGEHWKAVEEKLIEKLTANEAIGAYHAGRKELFQNP